MCKKQISSGSVFETKIGYSRAVADGDYVYVSGTTGYHYETMQISDDIAEQAEQCFRNIEQALILADSKITDIVRITYILSNINDFKLCWAVCRRWLGEVRPAATAFEAKLLNDKMKIEIEVTARLAK